MARGSAQVIAIGDVSNGRAAVQLYGRTISVPVSQVTIYQQHQSAGTLAPYRTLRGTRDGLPLATAG